MFNGKLLSVTLLVFMFYERLCQLAAHVVFTYDVYVLNYLSECMTQ